MPVSDAPGRRSEAVEPWSLRWTPAIWLGRSRSSDGLEEQLRGSTLRGDFGPRRSARAPLPATGSPKPPMPCDERWRTPGGRGHRRSQLAWADAEAKAGLARVQQSSATLRRWRASCWTWTRACSSSHSSARCRARARADARSRTTTRRPPSSCSCSSSGWPSPRCRSSVSASSVPPSCTASHRWGLARWSSASIWATW